MWAFYGISKADDCLNFLYFDPKMMFWTKTTLYKKLSKPTWLKTYSNEKAHFKVKILSQILSK